MRSASDRVGAGPRVLVLAEGADPDAQRYLRCYAPALREAGYRLTAEDGGGHGLVHVHGWGPLLAAFRRSQLAAVPAVVSLPRGADGRLVSGLVGQLRRWLTGRALAHVRAVLVPSEQDRRALLRLFPNLRSRRACVLVIADGIGNDETAGRGEPSDEVIISFTERSSVLDEAIVRLRKHGGVPAFRVEQGETGHLFVAPSRDAWAGAMRATCAGVMVLGCRELCEILRDTPARVYGPSVAELETALREALKSPWADEARRYAPQARERFDARRCAARLIDLYDRLTTAQTWPA